MALVTTTNYRRATLVAMRPTLLGCLLCAFINAHVPAPTDTASMYVEPFGSWYARYPLLLWGTPFVNGSSQGEMDEVYRTWTASGTILDESIYGYFVIDSHGNLVWAEALAGGPYPMNMPGQTVTVYPTMREGSLC